MQAEIITIGTELLLGQIADTNAAYLARQLAEIGLNIHRKTTVGDNELQIAQAVRSALHRSDVIITSGGLGPTVDDKTREAVATATNRKLVLNQGLLEHIEEFFRKRGREIGENNRRQAYLPRNAIPIHNPVGTAPGFIVKHRDRYVISLPGVPRELYHLTEHSMLPFLQQELELQATIKNRILRTAGIGESNIDRLIGDLEESANPTVGLAAHTGSVDIRISAKATDEDRAHRLLDEMEAQIRERLGDMIFGTDEQTIEEVVTKMLANQGLSLAVLETNTGGVLTSRLTAVPRRTEVLNLGLMTSLGQAVTCFLQGINNDINISTEVAEALARRVREQSNVDIGLAIIGDVDPDVGPYSEHTGNTHIALGATDLTTSRHIQVGGTSEVARARATNSALELIRRYLLGRLR